jgi:hypothetical protein
MPLPGFKPSRNIPPVVAEGMLFAKLYFDECFLCVE